MSKLMLPMRWVLRVFLVIMLVAGVFAGYRYLQRPAASSASAKLVSAAQPVTGFRQVEGPQRLQFPQDFGPHPDYQTEWWYYTGNLDSTNGHHYGYQLTFFRRAIIPPDQVPTRQSDWATDQIYMAHFAISDVSRGKFQSYERLQRGAAGLAGAKVGPLLSVWLEDWTVRQVGENTIQIRAAQNGMALDLSLEDTKGVTLQGEQGYSRKGPGAGNASIYFSQTHLVTNGTVKVDGNQEAVSGLSWMDHEYSTSALSHGQIGWDWFALQLSDGSELMVFNIRQTDGSPDPYSSGTFVAKDGSAQHLQRGDFKITTLATWKSPHDGAQYPSKWQVDVPGLGVSLKIEPYLADQENRLSFTYWEGAVKMSGVHSGQAVQGSGYVELTGYSGSLEGQF